MDKTLIGKSGYLFLNNDSCKELEVHCNNVNLVKDEKLIRYSFDNFLLVVFPNKSFICKKYLPDKYKVEYRPALKIYKNVLKNKIIDLYDVLKNEDTVYYKTDTHINLKGNYIVYKYFINKINEIYNLNITPTKLIIESKDCLLAEQSCGIGDLLWNDNLGKQIILDKTDIFYFSEQLKKIYYGYTITDTNYLRFLNNDGQDKTHEIINSIVSWEIVSKYMFYKKNNMCGNNLRVLIFYDSFLLSIISLYLELFNEVFMIKSVYNNEIINQINPTHVFEFRVERFLF